VQFMVERLVIVALLRSVSLVDGEAGVSLLKSTRLQRCSLLRGAAGGCKHRQCRQRMARSRTGDARADLLQRCRRVEVI
jgi:hypothetical protein